MDLIGIIMAKSPWAGDGKTRLRGATWPPAAVDRLAAAMLRCTIDRMCCWLPRVVVAIEPVSAIDDVRREFGSGASITGQAPGNLGDRMVRAWRAAGGGPAMLVGADCPDIPDDLVEACLDAVGDGRVALGPARDGGYWSIGAPRCEPRLFANIRWGTESVLQQTLAGVRRAGLTVQVAGTWTDVDRPEDVVSLRARLAWACRDRASAASASPDDPIARSPRTASILRRLRADLDAIVAEHGELEPR